jgi:hypothetical protein
MNKPITDAHNVPTQPQHSIGVVKPAHLDGVGGIGGMTAKPAAKKKRSK